MSLLLVSVIDENEAEEAIKGGADIIDIKNPFEGALGTPYPQTVQEIKEQIQGRKPFSVALGDYGGTPGSSAMAALGAAIMNPQYVKIAFPSWCKLEEVRSTIQLMIVSLANLAPQKTQIVAVAYADTLDEAPWQLEEFVGYVRQGGAAGCLIDTQVKDGRSLVQVADAEEIELFVRACHANGLFAGLAGSLRLKDIPQVLKLRPDLVGVRSLACGGDRLKGRVKANCVKATREILAN